MVYFFFMFVMWEVKIEIEWNCFMIGGGGMSLKS